ncbi:MAG: phosphate/phosphite/phosphonate ABC transporter substrate-binding protein [Prochloraceae cyanobacterium]|nr:phosphate/phosphite/phosphonate ABC transporter substrate-binding protein [Prochloraceae cyanobacterium]
MKRRNFLTYSLLFLTGCTTATNTSNDKKTIPKLKKLRFAVTDASGLEELEQNYGKFKDDLQEVLKTDVEFYPVVNYTAATPALLQNQVDLVLAGPSEYVILHSRAKAIPVIALTRLRYRSVIAVRADSGIKSLAQLKGKTIVVTNLASTASHLGSMQLLIEAGLNPQSDLKVVVLDDKTHGKQALEALKNGEVDAWGVVIYRYEKYLQDRGLSQKDFPAIARGKLLPNDVFIANSQLTPQFIHTMRSQMLANQDKLMEGIIAAESKFKGGSLVAANDSDYDMIRQVYRAIGQGEYID